MFEGTFEGTIDDICTGNVLLRELCYSKLSQ